MMVTAESVSPKGRFLICGYIGPVSVEGVGNSLGKETSPIPKGSVAMSCMVPRLCVLAPVSEVLGFGGHLCVYVSTAWSGLSRHIQGLHSECPQIHMLRPNSQHDSLKVSLKDTLGRSFAPSIMCQRQQTPYLLALDLSLIVSRVRRRKKR